MGGLLDVVPAGVVAGKDVYKVSFIHSFKLADRPTFSTVCSLPSYFDCLFILIFILILGIRPCPY